MTKLKLAALCLLLFPALAFGGAGRDSTRQAGKAAHAVSRPKPKARRPATSVLRRFEVLLPLKFNDGREVAPEQLTEAVKEVVDHFGAASYEPQQVEGQWRQGGILYRDNLVKIVVDVPDSAKNRQWMRRFKARWKQRLEQLDLWVVSYRVAVE